MAHSARNGTSGRRLRSVAASGIGVVAAGAYLAVAHQLLFSWNVGPIVASFDGDTGLHGGDLLVLPLVLLAGLSLAFAFVCAFGRHPSEPQPRRPERVPATSVDRTLVGAHH